MTADEPLADWERQMVWAADAVREVHQRDTTEPHACDWCGQAWPCEAIREWGSL